MKPKIHATMNPDLTARRLPSFTEFFQSLWGYEPFPWQTMLAERVVAGAWPQALDLPTAAGKTACIDVGIYALAAQAEWSLHERTMPRRVWFVVDRRIVVDEAWERAKAIANALSDPGDYLAKQEQNRPSEKQLSSQDIAAATTHLRVIADRLRKLSGTGRPLASARLRGGVLRDDGWARLPSQPAVITSTVDQIGSRLLFRSYGGSPRLAPIHAGLAANDSLILLDEAHCSVPFLQTLRSIQGYRGENWAEHSIASPFGFAILSATPPPDIPPEFVFPGASREAALAHPILHARLHCTKPAELLSLKASGKVDDDPFVEKAVEVASSWIRKTGKRRVAIIVNRVRTAEQLGEQLRSEISPDEADVLLLTGRLRPLERDALIERWKRFLRASNPEQSARPILLISTQCIEVGADFSFDALLTECASLDALRQRFGRLNRMGLPSEARAVILVREGDLDDKVTDPIYGDALRQTYALLVEKAKTEGEGKHLRRVIDFGFAALDAVFSDVDEDKLAVCLAPRQDAPVLMPAHLDLLCQTAPTPYPEPDISLFLHGKDRGVPEVRVLWRGDLYAAVTDSWVETIALCPPLSTESVSVPLHRLRRWLIEPTSPDVSGDVLGERRNIAVEDMPARTRPCLPWRGRDRSEVTRSSDAILPGDVVILPADYGLVGLAQALPDDAQKKGFGAAKADLWEWAFENAGKPGALRIHRSLWEPWLKCPPVKELVAYSEGPNWERERLGELIEEVTHYQPANEGSPSGPPAWLLGHLESLLSLLRNARIENHPAGGLILFARGRNDHVAAEPDLFADDDDLTSLCGEAVHLTMHTASVVRAAKKLTQRCLPVEFLNPFELAAEWHDAGKLDERFQHLLHHGDELAAAANAPLAKSADLPLSPSRRHAIRESSGLPKDFRHEMLSAQLAGRFAPLPSEVRWAELVLHLIASHHGHARPFAPVTSDTKAPRIDGIVGGLGITLTAKDRADLTPAHQIDSGVAERFWRLTRRYGWWGLAYLESILRLADWYGSEFTPAHQQESAEATP